MSKLSFYTDVNPHNQKKSIPLSRIFHWKERKILNVGIAK